MIARGFRPVGWVAAVGAAALGCYMVSLNVASSRAEVATLDRQIVEARRDIRALETELSTRGRLSQLEHWNAEVLALSAPNDRQFLPNELTLARFDTHTPAIEQRAKVQMASAEVAPKPQPKITPADYAAAAAANAAEEEHARPMVRRAALVEPSLAVPKPLSVKKAVQTAATEAKPAQVKKVALLSGLSKEIEAVAKQEQAGRRARN